MGNEEPRVVTILQSRQYWPRAGLKPDGQYTSRFVTVWPQNEMEQQKETELLQHSLGLSSAFSMM